MAHMNHGSSMHQYHGNHIMPNHGMGAMTDGQTKRDKDAIYGLVFPSATKQIVHYNLIGIDNDYSTISELSRTEFIIRKAFFCFYCVLLAFVLWK